MNDRLVLWQKTITALRIVCHLAWLNCDQKWTCKTQAYGQISNEWSKCCYLLIKHYVSLKPIVDQIMATVWLLCRKKTLDFSFFSRFYLPTIAVLEEKKNAISGNMKHNTNRKWLFGSTAIARTDQ